MENKMDTLFALADSFGEIAKKVNESSKSRKIHSENAFSEVQKSLQVNAKITKLLNIISNSDLYLRNIYSKAVHDCIILNTNIEYQIKTIRELKKKESIDPDLERRLLDKINNLSQLLNSVQIILFQIIEIYDRIVFLDNLIIKRKKIQKEKLIQLKTRTTKGIADAARAVAGSSSNLKRGLEMVDNFKKIKDLYKAGKKSAIRNLSKEANRGWRMAINVNKSSNSQLDFAISVKLFTGQLHQDSLAINDILKSKHDFFQRNENIISNLPEMLNVRIKDYLEVEKSVAQLQYNEKLDERMSISINDLKAHVEMACDHIREIGALNYDITEKSLASKELEEKIMEYADNETIHFNMIKKEVVHMTEFTRYPIEGSQNNIINAQQIEIILGDLAEML